MMFDFLGGAANGQRAQVGRAAFYAVRRAGELRRITGRKTLFELRDPQGRVLEINRDDLSQELVAIVGIQRAEIFNGLQVDNRRVGHGGEDSGKMLRYRRV